GHGLRQRDAQRREPGSREEHRAREEANGERVRQEARDVNREEPARERHAGREKAREAPVARRDDCEGVRGSPGERQQEKQRKRCPARRHGGRQVRHRAGNVTLSVAGTARRTGVPPWPGLIPPEPAGPLEKAAGTRDAEPRCPWLGELLT